MARDNSILVLTITSETRPETIVGPVLRKNRPGRHARKIASELLDRVCSRRDGGYIDEGGPRDMSVTYQCKVMGPDRRKFYTLRIRAVDPSVLKTSSNKTTEVQRGDE